MENEKRDTFERFGTKEAPVPVSADAILKAIDDGKNIKIEYPAVEDDLDIENIEDIFDKGCYKKTGLVIPIIPVHISILTENIAIWLGTIEELIEVDADEILNAIAEGKNIDVRYAVIKGDLDISKIEDRLDKDEDDKLIIQGSIRIKSSKIKAYADFSDTTFSLADFSDTTFSLAYFFNATFSLAHFFKATFSLASFSNATFSLASFWDATFSESAFFSDATFSSADFRNATFGGDANFVGAIFSSADFSDATFSSASFWDATFSESAFFSDATFSGYADFGNATFNSASFSNATFTLASFFNATSSSASFSNATFNSASFWDATFSEDADFRGATFSWNANFVGTTFGLADFTSVKFIGTVIFKKAKLRNVNFKGAQLSIEPNFDKAEPTPKGFDNIGDFYRRSGLLGGSYFFEQAGKGYLNEEMYSDASQSFRNAKIEYNKEGEYNNEGKMYVKEKDCIRLNLKNLKKTRIMYTWLTVWKYSSNYGESPFRLFSWIAYIVLFFAFIYMPIVPNWWPSQLCITFKEYPYHQWSDGIIDVAYNIITALYFSTVTFATLGFGDIAPVSIVGKICAIAEVLSGYLMFGVLITLVARKMTRS